MVTADPATWAEETFGGCDLGDRRRVRRLVTMAASLAEHSGKSLLGACGGTPAELEGTYRFVESEHVVGSAIRDGGFDATMKQVADFEVLLAVEDSTVLSYSHAPEGTGDLGGPAKTTSRGLWVHSALFVDPSTQLTVGLADQQWWVRPERKGKKAKATYEKRESVKWQRCSERMAARLGEDMSRVISVCDRESDVWEYLAYKLSLGQRFVVRSSSSRLLEGDGERLLEDEADSWWPEHEREVMVPQKGGRKQRKVTLEVAAAQVTLKVPSDRDPRVFTPLTVNVVQAYEVCPPAGEEPLFWRLYTTEPIDTPEQLDFILTAYNLRWRVEDFHKAWKTGCKVEELRLRSVDNIERAASILAFVAVRLLRLRERTEREPQAPCTDILDRDEWQCLWLAVEKTRPPTLPPTIEWAHFAIARLAGWYGSKKKGRVGWIKYWQGYSRFQDLLSGWRLAQGLQEM